MADVSTTRVEVIFRVIGSVIQFVFIALAVEAIVFLTNVCGAVAL